MFFSSVHCYDTQNRQEIRGLGINTVALLSLKMEKKKKNQCWGWSEEGAGRQEARPADNQAAETTLLLACYISSAPAVLRCSRQRNWCLVTPGPTSHLSPGSLRGALTAKDSGEGGLACLFVLLVINKPFQKPGNLPVKFSSIAQDEPFQDAQPLGKGNQANFESG